MSSFLYQDNLELYYEGKKKEVGEWLMQYTNNLKKVTKEQKEQLECYSKNMSFKIAGDVNAYVQNLNTVGKRDKKRLSDYLNNVEWLPDGVTTGILDGVLVSRVLPRPLDRLLGDGEWKSKKG